MCCLIATFFAGEAAASSARLDIHQNIYPVIRKVSFFYYNIRLMHLITSCSHIKPTTIRLSCGMAVHRHSARQTHTPQVNLCRQTSATCSHTANFGYEHFYELPENGPMDGPKHVGVF
jgi:hypothetical protein